MNAAITTLYSADFYRIIDFKCKCHGGISGTEYSKSFNLSFIRKGNFIYKVYRDDFDVYTGYAIIDKPASEHIVEHCHHIPDECTIIDFSDKFYQEIKDNHEVKYKSFFSNQDIQSLLVNTNNHVEYLHFLLLRQLCTTKPNKLYIDNLVMEILHWFLNKIDSTNPHSILSPKLKKYHLQTIENAKEYIFNNFQDDITLNEIASHCNISTFHFSHIFKAITHCSPYRFLRDTRLLNARRLIENREMPIKEACFLSGFQNIENFNSAFKQKYQYTPSYFKKSKNS